MTSLGPSAAGLLGGVSRLYKLPNLDLTRRLWACVENIRNRKQGRNYVHAAQLISESQSCVCSPDNCDSNSEQRTELFLSNYYSVRVCD